MTALPQYDRLESLGLWRPSRGDQRREVIVSFGDATLVVADGAGRPLSHWSLPAVKRLNPDEHPAIFAPDVDATETLEIDDTAMIEAIGLVRDTLIRAAPRRGRLRQALTALVLLGVLGLGAAVGPDLLRNQTVASIDDQRRAEIGATVLGYLQARTGPVCRSAPGRSALQRLQTRLFGVDGLAGQVVVLPAALPGPLTLPGGLIVVDRAVMARYDDPSVIAGDIVAATARGTDPLDDLLHHAGLAATVTLLSTGALPDGVLPDYAAFLLTTDPAPPTEDALLAAFAAARLPSAPYAVLRSARDQNGATLITNDPMQDRTIEPVLTDAEWLQLQAICDG
ncbi:hypothetical protein SAMN04488003_101285 [Loktanella fryxellensis]|uniref:Uncharacterized protein n=1 Tax=Loktanella fryxellensis TaxID=245187 RepID=A0A1H7YTY0_9RHOB|nr:hypothetical protein [Loktanella fryxellensis]SEM48817.1 hypothetical protein SAMN04488003_101285 [Loktanella fryxellensis]